MPSKIQTLTQLTRSLGEPENDYVIIGEGNTSCRIDDHCFWIKASGQEMGTITEGGFVAVRFEPILATLEHPDLTLAEQKEIAQSARVHADSPLRPSVEVSFHAMLLVECNATFIGHTHPTAVNGIMCSDRAEQFAHGRSFPDEVVLCGPESVFVPYEDPGLPLAITMREKVREYIEKYNEPPRVILLANHGLIALGQTATEILKITAMAVKSARIFAGACAVGEPVFMSESDIAHIYQRPDEIYRRRLFIKD